MRGDGCFIVGRPANIKSDFYYPGDKENPEPGYVLAPEELHYELDSEFAEPQTGEDGNQGRQMLKTKGDCWPFAATALWK